MDVPDFLLPMDPAVPPSPSPSAVPPIGAPTGGGSGGRGVLPGFQMQKQHQLNWCWAAVSASIAAFYGNGGAASQCRIAAAVLPAPNNNCCGADAAGACDKPWNLDQPLTLVGCYKNRLDKELDFQDIKDEIDAQRPLGCRVAWRGGGAHFMVVTGWSFNPATKETYVKVHDPWTGADTDSTYADLCAAFNAPGDRWTHSYLTHVNAGAALAAAGVLDPNAPTNA